MHMNIIHRRKITEENASSSDAKAQQLHWNKLLSSPNEPGRFLVSSQYSDLLSQLPQGPGREDLNTDLLRSLHKARYAKDSAEAEAAWGEDLRKAEAFGIEVAQIDKELIKSRDDERARPAKHPSWPKWMGEVLITIAIVASLSEWVNLGWYLRFVADGVGVGLLYALPILLIPLGESVALSSNRFIGPKIRSVIALLLTLGAIVFGTIFIYLCLQHGDSSFAAILKDNDATFKLEKLRLGFQIVTVTCLACLFLHGARVIQEEHAKPVPNDKRKALLKERKEAAEQAEQHRKSANSHRGILARHEAEFNKEHAVIRARQLKNDTLKEEFCRAMRGINGIPYPYLEHTNALLNPSNTNQEVS